jgi:hypothetical protein
MPKAVMESPTWSSAGMSRPVAARVGEPLAPVASAPVPPEGEVLPAKVDGATVVVVPPTALEDSATVVVVAVVAQLGDVVDVVVDVEPEPGVVVDVVVVVVLLVDVVDVEVVVVVGQFGDVVDVVVVGSVPVTAGASVTEQQGGSGSAAIRAALTAPPDG